jgi:cytochrome c5
MKMRWIVPAILVSCAMFLGLAAEASSGGSKDSAKDNTAAAATSTTTTTSTAPASATQDEDFHLEGERRFRSNCGRCHAAPPKFPPRMMATIVRHMRVRATITDQDMHLILRYMTE